MNKRIFLCLAIVVLPALVACHHVSNRARHPLGYNNSQPQLQLDGGALEAGGPL